MAAVPNNSHIDQSIDDSAGEDDHDHQQQPETLSFHDYHNSISSDAYSMMQSPYYVHSPISTAAANNNADHSTTTAAFLLSPTRSDDTRGFALSRYYSCSHGSSTNVYSFVDQKKVVVKGNDIRDVNGVVIVDGLRHVGLGKEEEDDYDPGEEEEEENDGGGGWWRRYCSLRKRSSCGWILMQLSWRFLFSLGVALLVFYLITNPPPPKLSIKVAGVKEFGLGEGVDSTGITTKILTLNCSLHLLVDNNSKLFGLHIHPPLLQMSFGRLPFAMFQGSKMYADSHQSTLFQLHVGTRNKAMYGAGRSMQDFLESGRGLPIQVKVRLSSHFRVVWYLIRRNFHHKVECMLLLDKTYDKKHRTQTYRSTCTII